MDKITVSADALYKLLSALNGPSHYIRELQVTRNPIISENNPIEVLMKEYNEAVDAYNASLEQDTETPPL